VGWQERPKLAAAATLWHLVGPSHEARNFVMRAWNHWHYFPADILKVRGSAAVEVNRNVLCSHCMPLAASVQMYHPSKLVLPHAAKV
jgi:hypothetical protein